ncbi:MAG: crotonase/enoyl-CoA hydratase family protein [Gammaproteobacteria bacterium]|nr:crotonase/enoyl-CoA hydratase family protein [Gammaproteobacteria bacterium]
MIIENKNFRDRVDVVIEHSIAIVSLNQPQRHNALDFEMFLAIDEVIKRLSKQRTIRVVILKGNGASFCSGLDVKAVLAKPINGIKLLWKWLPGNANLAQRVSVGWRDLKVPVIAVLHGKVWGGGLQIALGADFRIVEPDTSLSIMEAKWGLIPDMGGTLALTELLKVDDAIKLASTAEVIDANCAKKIGLVTEIAEDAFGRARKLAEQFAAHSPDVVNRIKSFYHSQWSASRRKILAKETLSQIKIILGKNQKIAVAKAQGKDTRPFYD